MNLFKRHCEKAQPTKQSSIFAKLLDCFATLAMTVILCFLSSPALADTDCRAMPGKEIVGPLAIVTGMADYKAAMDAGYAACMVSYPEEFAPLRPVNDFMQTNMQEELDQARIVLDRIIDKDAPENCAASIKKDAAAVIDGQYKKAYSRRHRAMMQKDLVSRDQDSCLIVLDMIKKYDAHYDDFKQLRFVLYESSKKQGRINGAADRKAFRIFEKARKTLIGQ